MIRGRLHHSSQMSGLGQQIIHVGHLVLLLQCASFLGGISFLHIFF